MVKYCIVYNEHTWNAYIEFEIAHLVFDSCSHGKMNWQSMSLELYVPHIYSPVTLYLIHVFVSWHDELKQ